MNTNPDRPAWILFLLSTSIGVAMIGLGIIWPLIPVYAVEMGAGGFMVGMIIASFNFARVLVNPLAGQISDRLGRKPFIVIGLLLYALVSLLYVNATNAESLILVRFFHGLTSVMVVPIAMALAADIAPPQKLGLYMGTVNMAVMLGLGVGPMLGGTIRDFFGMHAAFYAMGTLALLTCVMLFVFIPAQHRDPAASEKRPALPIKTLLKHRYVLGIFLMRVFSATGQGSVYTFLPLLATRMQITSSQVGIVLGVNIFLIAFMQRSFGKIADRSNPKYLIIFGSFLSGLAVLGMPFADGFTQILMLNVVMGAANGIAFPGALVITANLGKTMGMATLMGLTDAGWSLGMIVSPIMSGLIMDSLGLPSIFFTGGIIILIGTALISYFLKDYTGTRI